MSPRSLEGSALFVVSDFSMMNVRSCATFGQVWSVTQSYVENIFDVPFGSVLSCGCSSESLKLDKESPGELGRQ